LYSLLSEKSKESIINFEEGRNIIEANLKILNESFSDNLINKKNQTKSHALKEMIKNNIKTIIDAYLDVSQLNDLIYDIKSYLSKKNMKSIDDVFLKMQRVKKKK